MGVAGWFRRVVEQATGWRIRIATPGQAEASDGNVVRLVLRSGSSHAERTGSYRLLVADDGVTVTAADAAGEFNGLVTLRQLMPDSFWRAAPVQPSPPVVLPALDLSDHPAFSWRGVHIDVARHFMPKSFLLKLVDLISMHKFNVLHIHLTDDQGWRIAIDGYPRLAAVAAWRRESPVGRPEEGLYDGKPHGGFYTADDLREVVAYAKERFVEVLPEIDMPGHMQAAIAAYPELGNTSRQLEVLTSWGVSSHVLNLEESTLRFCTDVLDQVATIFPFGYVHIGGDECPTTEWESSERALSVMRREALESPRQLQSWFTARVAAHLSGLSRRTVCWDEVLELGAAPDDAVTMSWRSREGAISAAASGHDAVVAAQQWLYLDRDNADDAREPLGFGETTTLEKLWNFDPLPDRVAPSSRHHVLGAQCQLWTEYVATGEHAEYMYFPRLCAFSEVVWCEPSARFERHSFDEFRARLRRHLGRLDAIGVNYRPLEGPTPGQSATWTKV